jgi:hypothetical protein
MRPLATAALAASLLAAFILFAPALNAQDAPAPPDTQTDPSATTDQAAPSDTAAPAATDTAPPADRKPGAPKLEVLEPGVLFKAPPTLAGTTLRHEFMIRNAGNEPLVIESVLPGCGCTVASFDSYISPGRTGKVTVTLDLYNEWAGMEYIKAVTVVSNDPDNPRMRLSLKGKVLAGPGAVTPGSLDSDGQPAPEGKS